VIVSSSSQFREDRNTEFGTFHGTRTGQAAPSGPTDDRRRLWWATCALSSARSTSFASDPTRTRCPPRSDSRAGAIACVAEHSSGRTIAARMLLAQLLRGAEAARGFRFWWWLSGKVSASGGVFAGRWCEFTGWRFALGLAAQALAGVIQWVWSLSRLWTAACSRHSERAADLPLRWNRRKLRLNLFCAKTGSTVALRCL